LLARLGSALLLVLLVAGCTSFKLTPAATLDAPRFDVTPDRGDASTLFHVDAGALSKYDVLWDFGDGTLAGGGLAEHKYGFSDGVMTITMIVNDPASGRQVIATRTVTLGGGINQRPSVSLDASPSWAEVSKPVALTASASDGDNDPLSFLWTYTVLNGTAAGKDVVIPGKAGSNSISFDAAGKYEVKVRVRDPKGGEDSTTTEVDVSKRIPDRTLDLQHNGTLVAGTTQNTTASETLWAAPSPVPDTNVDAARYTFKLDYPASTLVFLTWNDTSTQGVWDMSLELRNADTNKTVFTSGHAPPTSPFAYNFTLAQPGHYEVIVRATTGAKIDYYLLIHANLYLTPDAVNAAEA